MEELIYILISIAVIAVVYYIFGSDSSSEPVNSKTDTTEIEMPKYTSDFVLFYSKTCPACQNFMPVWEQLKSQVNSSPEIKLKEVDCAMYPMETSHVSRVPTLILYNHGYNLGDTEGMVCNYRTIPEIKEFLNTFN